MYIITHVMFVFQSANGDGDDGMEDDGPGFMSGRVVVERREDLAKDDLRMMIRNEKNGNETRKGDADDDGDEEEEKENLESRRVVVKEEEEKDRREEERRENRRREDEKRKDAAGGRRVVRLEKSNNGEKAEEDDEKNIRQAALSRNERENEGRGETKSPVSKSATVAKKSKEPTPDAAEGEKR